MARRKWRPTDGPRPHRLDRRPPTPDAPHRRNCACLHCERARKAEDREADQWRVAQHPRRHEHAQGPAPTFGLIRDAQGEVVRDPAEYKDSKGEMRIAYTGAMTVGSHAGVEVIEDETETAAIHAVQGPPMTPGFVLHLDDVSYGRALSALYAVRADLAQVVGKMKHASDRVSDERALVKSEGGQYREPSDSELLTQVGEELHISRVTAWQRYIAGGMYMLGWLEGHGEPPLPRVDEEAVESVPV